MRRQRNSRRNRDQQNYAYQAPRGVWTDPDGNPHTQDERTGKLVPFEEPSNQRINSGYSQVSAERVESQSIAQDKLLDAREVSRQGWDDFYASNPIGSVLSFFRGVGDDRTTFIPAFKELSANTAQTAITDMQSINGYHSAMIDAPRQAMETQNALRSEGMGREMTRHHDGLDMAQQMRLEYEQTRRLEDDALQRAITYEIVQSKTRLTLLLAHN